MDWTFIDDVLVDVVNDESPSFSNEITDYPVEDGTVISDHINNKPVELSLDIIITGDDAVEKYERLREIRDNRELISVIGALEVYTNMAIQDLSLTKNKDNIEGFSASINLKQLQISKAETIIVEIAPPQIEGEDQPTPEGESSDLNSKDKKEDEVDEDTVKNKSLLKKMGDLF